MLAAAAGNVEAVSVLLDAGAEVNAQETARGQTALMFAAAYNRVDVIKLLARRGARREGDQQGRRSVRPDPRRSRRLAGHAAAARVRPRRLPPPHVRRCRASIAPTTTPS